MIAVHTLVEKGRSLTVDWVEESTPPEKIAETLSAMANSQGGMLIVGVRDAEITGVKQSSEAIEQVIQAALSLDPPLITPLPQTQPVEQKSVIVVQIPPGMPHVYALDGRYLHRQGADNVVLKPRELHQLFLKRGEISFELEAVPGATMDDFDWQQVKAYVKRMYPNGEQDAHQVLLKRGCIIKYGDLMCPTNAGILLFGKEPHHHLRSAEITAVRFAGSTMGDTFTRQDITGSLPEQIRKTETFLLDNLRKGVKLQSSMAREERYEYPMEAARELVVNAVAHRDYSIQGDSIRLFLFKDRMEVSSPGKLAGPITVDNIKDERFSRNPAIVQVLSDMGFIERLGYGVDRVIELMCQQSLKEPEFLETESGFRVTLYGSGDDDNDDHKLPADIERDMVDVPLNPRQEAALAYLKQPDNKRITNSELQRMYPDVHAETIRRDLADMVTKNLLRKLGQKRGSYYVLKNAKDDE